jgi:hypothetical protein
MGLQVFQCPLGFPGAVSGCAEPPDFVPLLNYASSIWSDRPSEKRDFFENSCLFHLVKQLKWRVKVALRNE